MSKLGHRRSPLTKTLILICYSLSHTRASFMVIRPSSSVHHSAVPLPFNPTPNCTSPISIDFREAAPAAAYAHMYSARPDDPDFDPARASRIGGLAVGVPGELRGLEAAYKACGGGVSWDRLFAPSVALARESHVGKELARRLNFRPFGGDAFSAWMLDEPEWAEIFAPEGELLAEGGVLKRESYARTLERLGKDGVEAFYTGDMARSIVRSVQDAGGVLTLDDFARYEAKVERAFEGTYRNRTYYTTQYPSGGPVIAHLLNVLETYDDYVDEGRTGLATHRFVEALKCECPRMGRPSSFYRLTNDVTHPQSPLPPAQKSVIPPSSTTNAS